MGWRDGDKVRAPADGIPAPWKSAVSGMTKRLTGNVRCRRPEPRPRIGESDRQREEQTVALELIVGPPNSNRAGAVLDRLRGAPGPRPGPGRSHRRRHRPLRARPLRGRGPQVGATIRTFGVALRRDRGPHRHPGAAAPLAAPAPGAGARRRRLDGSSRAPPLVRLAGLRARAGHPDRRAPSRARVRPRTSWPRPTRRTATPRRRASSLASTPSTSACATAPAAPTGLGRSSRGRSASRPAGRLGRRAGAHLRLRRPHGGPARPDRGSRRRLRRHVRRELLGPRTRSPRAPAC